MRMRRLLITLGTVAGCCATAQHASAAAPLFAPAMPGSAAGTPPLAVADAPPSSDFGTGWALQSSAVDKASGEVLSQPGYDTAAWQKTTVPNTVVGALVAAGKYPDPYFGMNLRGIPGTEYKIGERFTLIDMPATSPFAVPWWFRKEFTAAPGDGRSVWLHFDGLNYRANIWVNGTRIANDQEAVGAFRRFEFDITRLLKPGAPNAVAVQVKAPGPGDLAFMWVDWNPTPADKNMGLWGDVYLTESGPLALRHPSVSSEIDLGTLASAKLTVAVDVRNTTGASVSGEVRGTIEAIRFAKQVSLGPHEQKLVRITSAEAPGLVMAKPRLWWPYRMGEPALYPITVEAVVGGAVSDSAKSRFGIQQMTSELTPAGHRLFKVNGRPLVIRGGGWASDMLFRPASRERLRAELEYVKAMGLNTVRLEGKLEGDLFYDLADEMGILTMPGWCCCDQWEMWDKWDAEDHRVGPSSLASQAQRLRAHPSVIAWMNGSDKPPPHDVEKAYLDVLTSVGWDKPILSNATDAAGPVSGATGVKMRGPYDYVPPSYWLTDTKNGGAFGFATEIGPGAAVPPVESLREMLPKEHLWPIDDWWNFHAGGDEFRNIERFTAALRGRYGPSADVEDYARKAQALTYDGERAMFEAYARNKYTSTGVVQWMLNNAWPSLIWHLYDYYLRPGGGFYGTMKACEPVHVQYSYDDRSVAIVNDTWTAHQGLRVSVQVFDASMKTLFADKGTIDLAPDAVVRWSKVPAPAAGAAPSVYFVHLRLEDASGQLVSSNFYWLSTADDVLDWEKTEWFYTPTKRHADLTALSSLPATTLTLKVAPGNGAAGAAARATGSAAAGSPGSGTPGSTAVVTGGTVTISNTGTTVAFQVHLKALDATTGKEVVPVLWDDNYFALMPGESRELAVRYPQGTVFGPLKMEAVAWNAPKVTP